jgi:valyl-tRNA synthetase
VSSTYERACHSVAAGLELSAVPCDWCTRWTAVTGEQVKRLTKQAAKVEKDLMTLNGRLSSPSFVDKAPQKVVDGARAEAAELQAQLDAITEKMEQMKAMLPV